jgi:PAS domain S-box-containing protein
MSTKILLVDDEPDVEGMVKLKFRKQIKSGDYEFVFAQDGKDALIKLADNQDINIVISDINMPEMDGLTLLSHLGRVDRLLKAIIVSAYGDMDNIRAAMNRGAYDFVTKPIDFEDLQTTIEKTKSTIEEFQRNLEALKVAKTELSDKNARFSSIVDSAPDTILTFSSDGWIEMANPASKDLFAYEPNDLINKNISILLPDRIIEKRPGFATDLLGKYENALTKKEFEFDLKDKDGRIFPAEISISGFASSDLRMYTAIIRDISERKETQRILINYNSMLEDKVNERTKALVEMNKEKNEILAVAAHDLKNPICTIKMLARAIQDENISKSDIEEFSDDILETSERMFELIRNLLDINAIEQGRFRIQPETCDILDIVQLCVSSYTESAKTKNINLHFDYDSECEHVVFVDKSAYMQIIDNIISNAVKYTYHDKNIYVNLRNSNGEISLETIDEGPGISKEDIPKLFKKFSRLSNQPTGGEHSTGLGLSIVKKLCEMMNGSATVSSEVGVGSKFTVSFPVSSID